ncbi:MAG: hypothetical protein P4L84_13530 [Isosphaeraceae bacterium]|nr:hypothetical protein [Isosphaeraceae bacterium]
MPQEPTPSLRVDVLARSALRIRADQVPELRKSPCTPGGAALPASLLKHADEQTVAGIAAVLGAIEEAGLEAGAFGDWAVVVAPRHLGRATFFRTAFPQFQAEGAWGVSPHLISSLSLHSPSGAISLALKARGPNLGVGGGPGGEVSAFLMAAMMLEAGSVPGAWVVLSGWSRLRAEDRPENGLGEYLACAVALVPPRPDWNGGRLCVLPAAVFFEPPEGAVMPANRLADWMTDAAQLPGRPGPVPSARDRA